MAIKYKNLSNSYRQYYDKDFAPYNQVSDSDIQYINEVNGYINSHDMDRLKKIRIAVNFNITGSADAAFDSAFDAFFSAFRLKSKITDEFLDECKFETPYNYPDRVSGKCTNYISYVGEYSDVILGLVSDRFSFINVSISPTNSAIEYTVSAAYSIKYEVDSIYVRSNPTKTSYIDGDTLDLSGLEVVAQLKQVGGTEVFPDIVTSLCTYSPANGSTLKYTGDGTTAQTQTVSIEYAGFTTSVTITVESDIIEQVNIVPPRQTVVTDIKSPYVSFESLSVEVTYHSGKTKTLDGNEFDWFISTSEAPIIVSGTAKGYEFDTAGTYYVGAIPTIQETMVISSGNMEVTVYPVIDSLEVEGYVAPVKFGETFDFSTVHIYSVMRDSATETHRNELNLSNLEYAIDDANFKYTYADLTNYTIAESDVPAGRISQPKYVSIRYYSDFGGTVTKYSTITLLFAKNIESISVTKYPTKQLYTVGDTLDLSGIEVAGTFKYVSSSSGQHASTRYTQELTKYCTFSPASGTTLSEAATVTVIVECSYWQDPSLPDEPVRTTFTIQVNENSSKSAASPKKTTAKKTTTKLESTEDKTEQSEKEE